MAFAWGPDGKMWVVEMADYPLGEDGHGKPGGRVRFLEDTDGDGVYDKSTIFLHDAPYPTSVLPWKKGVLVAAAPDIFYAQDTDGDGKADKREVLFTGFKEGNQQHRLNHLSFGLDNWIYGANGDSGGTVKSIKTGKSVSISGRDFRFRPDTGEFEAIAGQSQFGRSRTDGGDWFGCNNSNPLWHFPLDEHYLKRNPHVPASSGALRVDVPPIPGASPVFPISVTRARFNDPQAANHFTSACSVHVYRDDLLPVPAGSLEVFVSEPVHNLVHREIVTPAGFTFAGKRAPGEEASEFLASSDEWFRPTTVDTGPDGALYIADMYRQVIEHPQWIPKDWQERLDLRAGHELGRIYRITPTTAKPRTIKWLNKLDDVGLVAALDSSNGWQRDLAQWMLLWRRSPAAGPALEELLKNSKNPLARAHALWTLAGLAPDAELKPRVIVEALADSAATVRRQAVKIAERFLGGNEAAKPQAADVGWALAQMSNEADPQVRLQLAYSLGEWDDPRAADVLARLAAQDSADRFMLAAILSSINEHNVRAVAAAVTEEAERNPPSPALLAGLFRAAVGTSNGDAIASTLAALTAKRGAGQYAPWQFQTMANLLDSLDESGLDLSKLGKDNRAIAAAAKGVDDVVRGARTTASDEGATPDLRAAAVGLLGRDPVNRKQDLAALDRMLSPQSPRELQAAVIRAIARRREGGLAKTLLDHWKGLTPDLRASAVDAMLARNERAKMLLDAVEKKSILPTEIDPARRQRLLQSPDKSVRERAEALLADVVSPNRQKVIDALSEAAILKGDAAKGQQIFTNTCAQCHRLGEIGKVVGPDLLSVGDKSPQGLLIAILDPNRAVEPRYVNYIATTRDGETYTGLLAAEAATSITLLGPDAQQQTIRRQDLTDLRSSNTSLMPEGIEANLKAQDLADLIAFVRAAR
jgi:putative membrane-bound dehydrogenase-like protein